ncbi:MAG: hypothetical protein LQ338_003746 [Usnochroma carphineum]|nr:MAG: hypothetical protein LQ338_003746 [Usnochroma carphineum]
MSTLGSPHLGGDQNKAPMLRAVLSSELAVATIVVALRFFTRLKLTRSPGLQHFCGIQPSQEFVKTPRCKEALRFF